MRFLLSCALVFSVTLPIGCSCGTEIPGEGEGEGEGEPNTAPAATIDAPPGGSTFLAGDSFTLGGSATDSEDGTLAGTSLRWSSSVAGELGAGESLVVALQEVGAHVITLTATDSAGLEGTATVSLTVVDALPPELTITSPQPGTQLFRAQVQLFAVDVAEGTAPVQAENIIWSSDLGDPVGVGPILSASLATPGTHVVTVTATADDGAIGTATVAVEVLDNFVPAVTILAPLAGSFHLDTAPVELLGSAVDPEDGLLQGAALEWLIDNVVIGTGASQNPTIALGDRVVGLRATDGQGGSLTREVTIHIVDNLPPVCTFSAPQPDDSFVEGDLLTFAANCVDPDGGPVDGATLTWDSDLEGALGTGVGFAAVLSVVGTHTISVCTADTADPTIVGCASLVIVVTANQPPTVTINQPDNGSVFQACDVIDLRCDVVDPESRAVSATWTSDVEGLLATTRNFDWTPTQSGAHALTCRAVDDAGNIVVAQTGISIVSPTLRITRPNGGDVVALGATVRFTAEACDTEDGNLNGASIRWQTDLPTVQEIGVGADVDIAGLVDGVHTIAALATDSDANQATDSIQLRVNAPPAVVINSPAAGVFDIGASINFSGSASDPEEGVLVPTWSSGVDGDFFVGASTTRIDLLPGVHRVELRAVDAFGLTGTDTVRVEVRAGGVGGPPLFDNFPGVTFAVTRVSAALGGEFWVLGPDRIVRVDVDGLLVAGPFTNLAGVPRDLAQRGDGAVFVATDNGLMANCDAELNNCDGPFRDGDLALRDDRINAVVVLSDGRTVVGTDDCAMISDWGGNLHAEICDGPLADPRVHGLAVDADDNVWFATDDGATRLTFAAAPSQTVTSARVYRDNDGLVGQRVNAVELASAGNVWFATEEGVVRLIDVGGLDEFQHWGRDEGVPANNVRDLAVDTLDDGREVAWGATAQGLVRVDGRSEAVQVLGTADGLSSNDVRSVAVLADHTKLVGTNLGVTTYLGQ